MNQDDVSRLLQILQEKNEISWIEAKTTLNDLEKIGQTISAVANAASYENEEYGYIIWGIKDKTWEVVGTNFSLEKAVKTGNQSVEIWLHSQMGNLAHWDTYEFDIEGKRVLVMQIKNSGNTPLLFQKVGYTRIDSCNQELSKYQEIQRAIFIKNTGKDWSAEICIKATKEDLDANAILVARKNFQKKNSKIPPEEIASWDDDTFLNKAKLTIKGEITNTALILLGKAESATLLSPAVAQITWILKAENGTEKDYEHFSPPFLLAVDEVYKKIRNLKYRYIQDGTLFPEEVDMYNPEVIREALHNCIAHQDYSLSSRIAVIENEDGFLLFSNKGKFLPKTVENVLRQNSPQEYYRNKFLVDAMVNLNMIDTIGSGIKTMFLRQKERFFPLPSYAVDQEKVEVKIMGKIIDINYSKALANRGDLSLDEIIILDRLQKGVPLHKEEGKKLKEKGLVEGRHPKLHISKKIAEKTGQKEEYIKNRGFDDKYYKDMICEYLEKYPGASRKDIDGLLLSKLPEILNEKQKKNKIRNILHILSKGGSIQNKGTGRFPKWERKFV